MLVCDTSAFYAATDTDEIDHAACAELLSSADAVVLPAPTLVELDQLAGSRRLPRITPAVLHSIADGSLLVAPLDLETYARVGELVVRYADFPLSFADAAVIAIAERLEQTRIATLDRRHFSVVKPLHIPAFELVP